MNPCSTLYREREFPPQVTHTGINLFNAREESIWGRGGGEYEYNARSAVWGATSAEACEQIAFLFPRNRPVLFSAIFSHVFCGGASFFLWLLPFFSFLGSFRLFRPFGLSGPSCLIFTPQGSVSRRDLPPGSQRPSLLVTSPIVPYPFVMLNNLGYISYILLVNDAAYPTGGPPFSKSGYDLSPLSPEEVENSVNKLTELQKRVLVQVRRWRVLREGIGEKDNGVGHGGHREYGTGT